MFRNVICLVCMGKDVLGVCMDGLSLMFICPLACTIGVMDIFASQA